MNYTNDNKLSLFLLNIRRLPDHFREMVTYLQCLNTKFKIIALTETWLKDHHTNYTLPNYNFEQTFDQRLEVVEYVYIFIVLYNIK